MKRKYVEDSCDSSDTCEPKMRKKNQLGTKGKIVKKKRKLKKKKKSRKATECLSNRKGREKDVIYTALSKVFEACGLASRKNAYVQFNYLYNDLKVQLCETTWAAFMHFLKGRTNYTVSLELETLSRKLGASVQSKEPGMQSLSCSRGIIKVSLWITKFKQFVVKIDS